MTTRLLVSVRNVTEASAALAGGCDVLDLKEPANGALGMVEPEMIAAVCDFVRVADPGLPLSVALGEALDWIDAPSLPQLPDGVRFLKLGTAGLGGPRWQERFAEAVARFQGKRGRTDPSAAAMIAVAYADSHLARAPAPEEVVEAASGCGCAGVLIDTFRKEAGRLTDWCDAARLRTLARSARRTGQMFALAGSLRRSDLSALRTLDPDIIGIRSAACRAGVRTAEIDPPAVRAFREAIGSLETAAMV